jgi:hypothetical protein
MGNNIGFKWAISIFIIVGVCFLGALLYSVWEEYDPIFAESVGITMITFSIVLGIGALLWELHEIIKWKPNIVGYLSRILFQTRSKYALILGH